MAKATVHKARKASKAKAPAKKAAKTTRKAAGKGKPTSRRAKPRTVGNDGIGLVTLEGEASETDRDQVHGDLDVPLVTLAAEDELEPQEEEIQAAPIVLQQPLNTEWSLPEQFLLVALKEGWDERMERVKVGSQGAALAASLLLELTMNGRLRIHLDRYQVVGEPTGDPALDHFANEVAAQSEHKAETALERLGRKAATHIDPWRGRLHRRGVAQAEKWRFLGIFPRSRTLILDPEAKAKLENRLQRTLVGGTPDVRTILLFGLIDAAALLPEIIPAGALAFNRKRINSLLTGRDPLGYRVDPDIHNLQGALVETTLRTVRTLQGNRD